MCGPGFICNKELLNDQCVLLSMPACDAVQWEGSCGNSRCEGRCFRCTN